MPCENFFSFHLMDWFNLFYSDSATFFISIFKVTMLSDLALAEMIHQENFVLFSSLALFNPCLKKGQPAHQEGCNLLQGGYVGLVLKRGVHDQEYHS
jgi:hypothetical protein